MGRPLVHDDDTKLDLLDAARRIAEAEGLEAISVRRLAEAAGVTTRAIYSIFGGKDELIAAMFAWVANAQLDDQPAPSEAASEEEQLFHIAQAYRVRALASPRVTPTKARDGLVEAQATIARGIASRRFRDRDANLIASELWALLHGMASLELTGSLGPPARADRVWNDAVTSMIRSFTRPPEPFASRRRRKR